MGEIASTTFVAVKADGSRTTVCFSLAAPELSPDAQFWRCTISLEPLYSNLARIAGDTSMQSLTLALSLGIGLLNGFISHGGRLEYESGEEYSLSTLGLLPTHRTDVA
jgi:hypothetical protein